MKRKIRIRLSWLTITALVAVAGLVLPACSGTPSTGAHSASNGPWKVGVQEPAADYSWREMALATLQNLAHQKPYASKIKSLQIVRTTGNKVADQNAAMSNLIASGVDLLIFDPASPTAECPIVRQAVSRGIVVVSVAQTVNCPGVYNVATDYTLAGELEAHWLCKELEAPKNVAFFQGIPGAPINEAAVPVAKKILRSCGATIVSDMAGNWDPATTQQQMTSLLRANKTINGVYVYLAGGSGVIRAYANAGVPFVPVTTGGGYNEEPCLFAKYKSQGLKAYSASGQQAIYALGLQKGIFVLEGKKIPHTILVPPTIISTDTDPTKACLPDKPGLFPITYTISGLDLPLAETLKYYQQ